MIDFLKKTGVIFLTAFIMCSFMPFAFAQSEVPSPLEGIKEKLQGEGIEVVDYSENKWGKLPERIIEALDAADYAGLAEMYQDLDITPGNQQEFDDAIKNLRDDLSTIEYEYTNDAGETVTAPLSEDDIDLIISEMEAYQYAGERQIRDAVMSVVNTARNIIGSLAILWIVVSGIRMAFAGGDETAITEQKRSIIYAMIGLVAILLVERMIDILYGPLGEIRMTLDVATTTKFSTEILGLVSFIKAIFGTLAILMMVISGIKIVFAMGEEEKIKKQKQALFWIIIGFVLVLINKVVIDNIFIIPIQSKDQISASNVTTVINLLGTVIQFALGFVGLFALGALIYGAGTMVANYGNDEVVQKSKKIIKNAIIGIIVIISAYTIVATLIVFK
jgi:hypothetical protein